MGWICQAFALLLAASALSPAPRVRATQDSAAIRLDFSHVTSNAITRRLAREGRLVKIYLFPRQLGGPDDPHNIGYVPREAADRLAVATTMLAGQVKHGTIDRMDVVPDYKGRSFVPSRITMTARKGDGPGVFERVIEIW